MSFHSALLDGLVNCQISLAIMSFQKFHKSQIWTSNPMFFDFLDNFGLFDPSHTFFVLVQSVDVERIGNRILRLGYSEFQVVLFGGECLSLCFLLISSTFTLK